MTLRARFKKVTPPRYLCRCYEPSRQAFAPSRRTANWFSIGKKTRSGDRSECHIVRSCRTALSERIGGCAHARFHHTAHALVRRKRCRQAAGAETQASTDPAGRGRRCQRRGHPHQRRGRRVHDLPNQAALCRRQPGAGVSEEARPGPEPKIPARRKPCLWRAGFGEGVQMIIDLARDSADQRRG